MEKKILDFYASKNLHVAKMIEKRPPGISRGQVELAAVEMYRRITGGTEAVRDIRIAWRVWEIARNIRARGYEQDMGQLVQAQERVAELIESHERQVAIMERYREAEIRKLRLRFWIMVAANSWLWAVWLLFTW